MAMERSSSPRFILCESSSDAIGMRILLTEQVSYCSLKRGGFVLLATRSGCQSASTYVLKDVYANVAILQAVM
jgi:hypothetical protein